MEKEGEKSCNLDQEGQIRPYLPRHGLERHSLQEWRDLTIAQENQAAASYARAEWTRATAAKIRREVKARTLEEKAGSSLELKTRAQVTFSLATRLKQVIQALRSESGLLDGLRVRVSNALSAMDSSILHVTQECGRLRGTRAGIELTLDGVEIQLQKERDLLLNSINELECFLAGVVDQIGATRGVKEALERDWSDKMISFRIDDGAQRLANHASGAAVVNNYPGVGRWQEGMMTMSGWEDSWKERVLTGEKVLEIGASLRNQGPLLLTRLATALQTQARVVDVSLSARIRDTEEAKRRLEHQLKLVLAEMVLAEKGLASMRSAIREDPLAASMRLAQTRLYNRTFRPCPEMTKDSAQSRLIQQLATLSTDESCLQGQICCGEDALQSLRGIRIDLEKEIAVKDHSLVVDRERVQEVRGAWPGIQGLLGK